MLLGCAGGDGSALLSASAQSTLEAGPTRPRSLPAPGAGSGTPALPGRQGAYGGGCKAQCTRLHFFVLRPLRRWLGGSIRGSKQSLLHPSESRVRGQPQPLPLPLPSPCAPRRPAPLSCSSRSPAPSPPLPCPAACSPQPAPPPTPLTFSWGPHPWATPVLPRESARSVGLNRKWRLMGAMSIFMRQN